MYTFTLINIYGPNRDKPDFYKVIRGIINDFSSDFVIISGDFNLILNPNIDCENYRNVNNPNAWNEVLSMQNEFKLVDIWRVQNEDKCRFTWFSNTPLKRARLDFFLVSEELSSLIVKTDIHPGYRTDHSLVEIEFKLNDHKKGRGFWTFNNSLLKDAAYIEIVNKEIRNAKLQYTILPNKDTALDDIQDKDLVFNIVDQLFLETVLCAIRGATIAYASFRKRTRNNREKEIEGEINNIEKLPYISDESKQNLLNLKDELIEYRKKKLKALW